MKLVNIVRITFFPGTTASLSEFLLIDGMYVTGNWVYSDSTPMTYKHWDSGISGQPQNNADHYIGIGKNNGYYWHNIDIDDPNAKHFLCEYKI